MTNRLANESSPYLRQHAANPVEWWPWCEAAFAEAKRLDRPVFVSIGYAACHWCHVMAHESFEHAETAALMNRLFVNVKVDREELPDVDAIYMNAIMVMGEGGGWPLNAFCLPDGRPYFLGTYFPREPRYGRPGFGDLLAAMSEAYRTRREDAEDNAMQLVDGLRHVDAHYRKGASDADRARLDASLLVAAGRKIAERCDKKYGGISGAPKFPSSATHRVLAIAGRLPLGAPAKAAYETWSKGMRDGGIYDHLGGGFARYSVDAKWLVPHFEKMLYDQAQLLEVYAGTAVGDETVAFLERELSDPGGGLWSSLDADSEGEEGKFYVWTPSDVRSVLGPMNAMLFNAAYGVTDAGNFEHATTVLSRVTARGSDADEEHLAALRARLLEARAKRVRPGTDDKVLAGWNGLAVSALVAHAWGRSDAGSLRSAGADRALQLALRVGEFLRRELIDGDRVRRIWRKDLDGTLDDYAFCARAFFDLADATCDKAWWELGARLVKAVRERFVEETKDGVVFYLATAGDKLLVHRPESHHDGAIPSGAAIAVDCLVRMGYVAHDDDAMKLAERYLTERLTGSRSVEPWATSALLAALDRYLHGATVIVTPGANRDALLAEARRAPNAMIALFDERPGENQAYVCRGQTCSLPVSEQAALHALLHPVHQQ